MVMEIVVSVILLFVGIAVLVVIHVCIVGRAFRNGNQGIGTAQRSNIVIGTKILMSSEDLKMIPCFDYVSGGDKGTTSLVECAVCLENFKTGDKCRLLPTCTHIFHSHCIDLWLLKTPICPICRSSAKVSKNGVVSGEPTGVELA